MRNVIRFPRDQQLLLPVDMTEWLSEDDPVFFIMDIISNLDLHEMYEVYREDGMGGAFFDPEVMLGIILLAPSRDHHSESRCNPIFSPNPRETTSLSKSTFK